MKIEHSFAWALRAGGFAAAAILAPQVAQASPHLTASYAGTPYTLAASCDPNQPVLFIHLTLGNTGDTPTPSHKVTANEPAGSLAGEADLAAIAPGTSVDFTLPVRLTTSNSIAFVGDHTVAASAGPRHLAPLHFSVPMSLCAPTPAPAPPQVGIPFTGGATQAPNFRQQLTAKVTQVPPALPAPAASATVSPFLHRSLTAVAQKASRSARSIERSPRISNSYRTQPIATDTEPPTG